MRDIRKTWKKKLMDQACVKASKAISVFAQTTKSVIDFPGVLPPKENEHVSKVLAKSSGTISNLQLVAVYIDEMSFN